jgi:DNA-binding response OmpR family regulator
MDSPKSILVVDDDPNLRQTLVLIIRNAGYEVFYAENAQQCLLLLKSRGYHLLVLDHKIPDMNGLSLLAVIRRMYPGLPVLFLTGNESAELKKTTLEMGVRGYLVKPVDPEEILNRVHAICR